MIEIVKGDITEQDVDAIVNAAHEALMGGGGVDGAIHRKAGSGLHAECVAIPETEPGIRCKIGEAHITSGCKLKARYIIHTVAPRFVGATLPGRVIRWQDTGLGRILYENAQPGTEEDLANCYRNVMKIAAEKGLESIAFSSLGTGGHSWPIEIACPIALKTTLKCLADVPSMKMVRFVCFSDLDAVVYEENYEALTGGTGGI